MTSFLPIDDSQFPSDHVQVDPTPLKKRNPIERLGRLVPVSYGVPSDQGEDPIAWAEQGC